MSELRDAIEKAVGVLTAALEEDEEDGEEEEDEEDVTDDCGVQLGRDDGGGLRMYLVHKGSVIMRAGCDKTPGLTDYATVNGYSIVPTSQGVRGSYFRILKS